MFYRNYLIGDAHTSHIPREMWIYVYCLNRIVTCAKPRALYTVTLCSTATVQLQLQLELTSFFDIHAGYAYCLLISCQFPYRLTYLNNLIAQAGAHFIHSITKQHNIQYQVSSSNICYLLDSIFSDSLVQSVSDPVINALVYFILLLKTKFGIIWNNNRY